MIYFIQVGHHFRNNIFRHAIKIGYTNNLAKRFQLIQGCNCEELVVLGVIPKGTKENEHELHQEFASDCVRGEWYHSSNRILSYIEKCSVGYRLGKGQKLLDQLGFVHPVRDKHAVWKRNNEFKKYEKKKGKK